MAAKAQREVATSLGAALAAFGGYFAFGPVVETTYFRTDIGGETEGLFVSETPTDFSSTSVNWVLLAFMFIAIVVAASFAASALRELRNSASNRSEGST